MIKLYHDDTVRDVIDALNEELREHGLAIDFDDDVYDGFIKVHIVKIGDQRE